MNDDRLEGMNLLPPDLATPEASLEVESSPDVAPERSALVVPEVKSSAPEQAQISSARAALNAQTAAADEVVKEPYLLEVENILSANLGEIYLQLPESKRQAFRVKGEETAKKIQVLLQASKVKTYKILQLISAWLGVIPGVNVYFLRQESKIKLDRLLDYREAQLNQPNLDL